MINQEFFLVPEEVFRLGNSFGPRLSNVRPRDINTIKLNGINVVIANGKGVSVFDKEGIMRAPMAGWVWRFPPNTSLPFGLKLVKDKPHHFCIAPVQNMPVDKYKGLLEEFALKASRVFKKEGKLA
ncbi:MAG: hypothetical protein WD057_11635 [Aquisalimonadaceae bacterium]